MKTQRSALQLLTLFVWVIAFPLHTWAAPFAYVTNSGKVYVINLATNLLQNIVPTDVGAFDVAVHPDGTEVYVINTRSNDPPNVQSGTVSVIDTKSMSEIAVIDHPALGITARGIAIHPDGSKLYVVSRDSHTVAVIDVAQRAVTGTISLPSGSFSHGIEVLPDGSKAYVTHRTGGNVSVIDLSNNTVVKTFYVGPQPVGVAVHPLGTFVYVTNLNEFVSADPGSVAIIDPTSDTVVDTVEVGFNPWGVVVHPDGSFVYTGNEKFGTVSIIDTSDNTLVDTIDMGVGAQTLGVGIHPDGSTLYAVNCAGGVDGNVAAIDTNTLEIEKNIHLGGCPIGLWNFVGGPFPEPIEGLVASYPFNGNANDASGNGKDGTVIGATPTEDRFGTPTAAYHFASPDQKITIPSELFTSTTGTISMWFNTNRNITGSIADGGTVSSLIFVNEAIGSQGTRFLTLDLGNYTSVVGGEVLGVNGGTGDVPGIGNNPRTAVAASTIGDIAPGWHHVVLTSNESGHFFYLDGVKYTPDRYAHGFTPATNLWPLQAVAARIGGAISDGGFDPSVVIDDVRIYNQALSDLEVQALYAPSLNEGLVAAYPFGGDAQDVSGNGKDGTVIGATLTEDRFGTPNAAYHFASHDQLIQIPPDLFTSNAGTVSLWFNNTQEVTGQTGSGSINRFIFAHEEITNDTARFIHLSVGDATSSLTGEILAITPGENNAGLGPSPRSGVKTSTIGAIPPGWHHLVVTSNAQGHMFYLDGVQYRPDVFNPNNFNVFNASSNIWPVNAVSAQIGGLVSSNSVDPVADIDDVRIYNRALSPSEIQELFALANVPPTADAGEDQLLEFGDTVVLDGSGSSDPDGDPLTYSWTLRLKPSGSLAVLSDPSVPNPTFIADKLGTFEVDLEVSDALATSAIDSVTIVVQDTTPPTLTLPEPLIIEATDQAGAVVTYMVITTDNVDENPDVSCSSLSGSQFALGTTTVTCTATDASDNSTTDSFAVTVVDTTAPLLVTPADITVVATSPAGANVSFIVTATDSVDQNPLIAVTQASGTTFPVGSTTVTATASDASGNSTTASFTITVLPSVTGVDPGSLPQGATDQILTITGDGGFGVGAAVRIGGSGLTLDNVTVLNSNQIVVTVSVDRTAPTGNRTVEVTVNGVTAIAEGLFEVVSAGEALSDMTSEVTDLLASGDIANSGTANSVLSSLMNTNKALNKGNDNAASGTLNATVNKLNAFLIAGKISQGAHDSLVAQIEALLSAL